MVVWSVPPFAFMTYLISFQRIKSCHRGRIHDCSCLGGFTQVLTTPYLRLKLFFFVNFTQLNAKVAEVWLGEYNLCIIRATLCILSLITAYLFLC